MKMLAWQFHHTLVRMGDGEALQDGGIYLARPEPLSLAGEVEYELERNGKPIGLFDIKNAGQYTAWNRKISFPTMCKSAGHAPSSREAVQ